MGWAWVGLGPVFRRNPEVRTLASASAEAKPRQDSVLPPTLLGQYTWITVALIVVVRAGSNLPTTDDFVWGNAG